jgi:hypothetical protein
MVRKQLGLLLTCDGSLAGSLAGSRVAAGGTARRLWGCASYQGWQGRRGAGDAGRRKSALPGPGGGAGRNKKVGGAELV